MFKGHASSFNEVIQFIQCVVDPRDPSAAAQAGPTVERLRAERFQEEMNAPETGPFRRDYAAARLEGAVEILLQTRRLAVQAKACREFLALIDSVIADARTALSRASARFLTSDPVAPSGVAPWAQATLTPVHEIYDLLPGYVKDI